MTFPSTARKSKHGLYPSPPVVNIIVYPGQHCHDWLRSGGITVQFCLLNWTRLKERLNMNAGQRYLSMMLHYDQREAKVGMYVRYTVMIQWKL